LIGSLLNFFFFGTLLVQGCVWSMRFPLKLSSRIYPDVYRILYFILLSMTVCVTLNAADVEYWYGVGFDDISRFADPRQSRFYTPIMGSFIGLLVQLFFCYRI
ncbi:hypothetical protein B0H10DRAFT_1659600, partial [Mycena sp. CBHHK59/15]